ncbi:hypothetical protein K432DRAFT_58381 [Lepidopterella palustris CBS 459.81]|uniref:Uncharacterized protein n=1 Tax=Lepidopterella palustris CBS 459.81 TaxID=1314670 RepID=A0A8E2E9A5_9PEZI|nr:hypothetical protein K432DRAFT_58381 [Lepidopterella palustris CBS 459.81]
MKGRKVMGKKHRMLHRRQAAATSDLTVIVNVVATVDQSGSTVAVETLSSTSTDAPASAVATAPSVASAQAVPAVPPFPSDLTVPAVPQVTSVTLPSVPAYPFTSTAATSTVIGAVSIQAIGASLQAALSTPPSTPLLVASSIASAEFNSSTVTNSATSSKLAVLSVENFSTTIRRNSTVTSNTLTYTSLPFTTQNITISSTSVESSTSYSSASTSESSSQASSLTSNTASPASSATIGGGGYGAPNSGAPAASSTPTAATGNGANNGTSDNSISTPQVIGSVVGSIAGLTVILILALLILRRYKRKRRGALQLSENDATDTRPIAAAGQQMAQRTASIPTTATSFFSRFSGSSRGTADPGGAPTSERGFQRISGRKLPSAFSEGMTSDSAVPFDRATLSGTSFYRDSQGFYGGPGMPAATPIAGKSHNTGIEKEKLMPSPARTPVVHHPEEFPTLRGSTIAGSGSLSPPQSPLLPGTLGRSHPSHDGSRGSKFTEDV